MIKQAAILRDGTIWTLPRPARHHHIIAAMNNVYGTEHKTTAHPHGTQGFITEQGSFMDRMTAPRHAEVHNQLAKPLLAPPNLFSEDLW